jgi:hypothetical protein
MVRKKTRAGKTRLRRTRYKLDAGVTSYRFKLWQYVRAIRLASALGKQNLIEDELISWLEEHNAPAETIDYYLGYAKRAEELAERFAGYPLELALDEIKREAEARGLNVDLILYCIEKAIQIKGWVERASYFDRNGLASRDLPFAGGCFCSFDDSVPLVFPERFSSPLIPWLWRVNHRARVFADDMNVLLVALLYAIYLTPALRIYYFPFAYLGPALEIEELPRPPAFEVSFEVPEPWSVLMKRWSAGDLVSAEDWNDILEIAEYLRLYWAPDLDPFPTRFEPSDCLRSDLYNEIITLVEGIMARIPPPPVEWFEVIPPPPTPPAAPHVPELTYELVLTEDWGFGGFENPGRVVYENWCYLEPSGYTLILSESWSE